LFSEFKIYWTTFTASLQAKLEYKLDFFIGILTSTMLQLAALGFLWVIFHQTSHLEGWNQTQVVFLLGLTAAALGLSELFFNHIWMLPFYIVMGDLDRLLVYPVRSLPFLLISRPELHSFGNMATGLVLVALSLWNMHSPWWDWALVPVWAFSGSLIYTSALVIFSSVSFQFVGPYSYSLMIPHTLLQATRYPLNIYPQWVHFCLLFLVPFGAFNYLPGKWIFRMTASPLYALAAPVVAFLFMIVAEFCWTQGLKRYQSTGS
jgi:ABC-2 type transport system permease protein